MVSRPPVLSRRWAVGVGKCGLRELSSQVDGHPGESRPRYIFNVHQLQGCSMLLELVRLFFVYLYCETQWSNNKQKQQGDNNGGKGNKSRKVSRITCIEVHLFILLNW
ncbi:hypothetical protein SAY86_018246 [Trapa natans]|uniref:Uncharacterized protein n=1 Tax=Trapa natans TaxID=22666 RepID=A0AAN7LIS7_TRANT|nr:hypothetical protein SAY86_018246 [Trapa natans]